MKPSRKSIASSALFRMSAGIAAVIVISSLFSYWRVYESLETQTLKQLDLYITERGQRESIPFQRVEKHHAMLKTEFLSRLRGSDLKAAESRFDTVFEKLNDGTIRTRRKFFDGFAENGVWFHPGITGFIGRGVEPALSDQKRVVIAYDLMNSYAPAWRDSLLNLYMAVSKNTGLIYWPGIPWDLEAPADTDLSGSEWAKAAAPERNKDRKTVWTKPYFDSIAGSWMVSCITPLDIDGEHAGHIGSDIILEDLFQRIFQRRYLDSYGFILGTDGRVVVHPNLMETVRKNKGGLNVIHMDDPFLDRVFQWALTASNNGGVKSEPIGGEYVAAVRIKGPGWLLIKVFPQQSVTGPAGAAAKTVLGIGFCALIPVIIWMFIILQRKIVSPLHTFVVTSGQIADGQFDSASQIPLPSHRKDEIGELARSFTHMDEQLRHAFMILENRAEERAQLVAAIEQTSEIIMITDEDGCIQYVNPAFEKITGYTGGEVIGGTPRILKSGRHDNAFYREMWDTLKNGAIWRGNLINKRKDGTLFTEETAISPVRDAAGRIISFVAVKRDITEKLLMAEEKNRLEAQFHQAQKLESVGRLAGGVAHDLNNLLTPILGYGELLLYDFEKHDPYRASVEQIVNAAFRARDLVGQLLAFSRKQILEIGVINLNSVLERFYPLLRYTIREDIAIEIIPAPSPPMIKGDAGQLEQVIMNLAVNAQDAMPEGGALTIETAAVTLDEAYAAAHQSVQPGEYVMLAFSDTGTGIDEETRERLFEPFFTTKMKNKGAGLGLATVYGIVKQHGGNIWVYSEPGKGTTFKVYLPASLECGEQSEDAVQKGESAENGSETILLAEDDAHVRELAFAILERRGYRLLVAENGLDALNVIAGHKGAIHLLLTDVIMPEMSGKELYNRLSDAYPDIKVLYMSGYTDNVIAHRGVLDEGVAFIQKPFSVEDLALKVRNVLDY